LVGLGIVCLVAFLAPFKTMKKLNKKIKHQVFATGGCMQRWFRLSSLLLVLTAFFSVAQAQDYVEVRGSLTPGNVRVFVRDTVYRISGTYTIGGTLIIEPGTRVEFLPNGRLIDSTGGRIIADGRASANYNATAVNPLFAPYNGYNDPQYFGAAGVVSSSISTEPTIHPSKYPTVFNVNLGSDPNLQNLTPGKAILYSAARLHLGGIISAIRLNPWFREKATPINVRPARITFAAGDVNNFSREWGHIIVLPGASAAFFRDVDFLNFRKDTTVDNEPIYLANQNGTVFSRAQAEQANDSLLRLTNGSGGAITTFSVRTWIVGCNFRNNLARYRGGALQVLQAPADAFVGSSLQIWPTLTAQQQQSLPIYNAQTNPWLTDPNTAQPIQPTWRGIDLLHETAPEPVASDALRAALDDARMAVYLGRIRQIRFTNNRTLMSEVDTVRIGAIRVLTDVDRAAAVFGNLDRSRKNESSGGAVYISGRTPMLIGFGINDFQGKDTLEFNGNMSINRQPNTLIGTQRTLGAKGGAVHVANNTGVIFAGRYISNRTMVPYITGTNPTDAASAIGTYSQGGAIYASANAWQIQVRGNLDNNPPTHFTTNESGRGGAIYVEAGAVDTMYSPHIGGSDGIIAARNYGYNIKFRDNRASFDGGAIYTARNMQVYGAGGVSGPLWVYGSNYSVEFQNNVSSFSGGAVTVNIPQNLPIWRRNLRFVRSAFINNNTGNIPAANHQNVRGGGALYTINADLNLVKGSEFRGNRVFNGNGGAIAMVTPDTLTRKRFMLTDLDSPAFNSLGVATGYSSRNDVFTFQTNGVTAPLPDERMLTRFYDNIAFASSTRQGSGVTQRNGTNLNHPQTTLRENGTGLGGAIYILDSIRVRVDTFQFDRVRFQNNTAHTGAVVYSDNYDLKLAFQRSLITGNIAVSTVGRSDDKIEGPLVNNENQASSDLAGAVLYGEITGPLPWNTYSFAGNSIYDNNARFIIRLPDAQDTKGVLAGTTGIGFGGVDTLRGNYWGRTEANVSTILPLSANQLFQRIQQTFFIAGNGKTHMRFVRGTLDATTEQGPFESTWRISYKPIPAWTIPDTLLMAGRVYDIFDKGTDIKTADYGSRRMSPIEDFAVGIPPTLRLYNDPLQPSFNKYVKRMTRNPFDAETDQFIARVQTEFVGNHPIGYPVFLEARADYSATAEVSNNDPRAINETVFFAINERTGDFVRVNLRQKGLTDTIYRARLELVPDSTNSGDPNIRRAYEGLATYGSGATLLSFLVDNAIAEDSSALGGRRWEGSTQLGELGGQNFRLNNRPALPTSNSGSDGAKETYYGGERYRALPVRNGDAVTIVSRTALWKNGAIDAINGSLSFVVNNNTQPPVLTGAADTLANSPLIHPQMRNRVFVTENRLYTPITAAQSPRPGTGANRGSWFNEPSFYPVDEFGTPIPALDAFERDTIFTITATDTNRFFDPRVIIDSTKGAYLSYFWNIRSTDANNQVIRPTLPYWLRDTLVKASDANNMSYGAVGFRMLRGRPINPYIVPGGEEVEVTAKNFPPSVELVDSLRASGYNDDVISKWLYLYPSYFHAEEYDNNALAFADRNPTNTNARYLQQDTVNFGWNDETSYRFRIHVVDSMPRFLWAYNAPAGQFNNMLRGDVTIVLDQTTTDSSSYIAPNFIDTLRMTNTFSRVGRRLTAPNAITTEAYNNPLTGTGAVNPQVDDLNIQFVANLTDSLRFMADINTDDEFEDAAAVDTRRAIVQELGPWDFRFGKTSYAFQSTAIRETPGDTVVDEVMMARPIWMRNNYLRKFNTSATADLFAEDLTSSGRINIRIDGAEAREILKPRNDYQPGEPYFGDLNTDSIMTIVVNDGHGGINQLTRRLFVNVQPQILEAQLPDAIEDQDYNPELLDSSRAIKVYDPNWGQARTFRLIYTDETLDSVPVDPYFPEAGQIILDSNRKTTPAWLKIVEQSGLLYGTPRVTDVPFTDTTVRVTVLVTDAGNLRDIRTFTLRIQARNHEPELFSTPVIRCVDVTRPYTDTIRVTDIDLARTQSRNETLTFEVLAPSQVSFTFTPATLASPINDTSSVVISTSSLSSAVVGSDNRITIRVRVTDRAGTSDTLVYQVAVSAATRCLSDVKVTNNLGAFQILTWGLTAGEIATRGDEAGSFGRLDANFCEYELPPVPYIDVFDARWTIPNRQGILRNIYPFAAVGTIGEAVYRARFQAGGETGQSSAYYPVTVSWKRSEICAANSTTPGSYYIRDDVSNGALFDYNMKLGTGSSAADIRFATDSVENDTLFIFRDAVKGFIIVYDFNTSVDGDDVTTGDIAITGVTPNPFASSTTINFTVPNSGLVTIEVFDALGAKIGVLKSEVRNAGADAIEWNGTMNGQSLASGTYTVKISSGVRSSSQQVVIVR
jgi:predicted outer membrane repeat protein